jgi:hypothetical protein
VTQTESVTAGAVAHLSMTPASATVVFGKSVKLTTAGTDAYGNAVAVTPTWTLSSSSYGRLSGAGGSAVTFTAASRAGTVTATASSGGVTATARLSIVKR